MRSRGKLPGSDRPRPRSLPMLLDGRLGYADVEFLLAADSKRSDFCPAPTSSGTCHEPFQRILPAFVQDQSRALQANRILSSRTELGRSKLPAVRGVSKGPVVEDGDG